MLCRYAECHYAECRGPHYRWAVCRSLQIPYSGAPKGAPFSKLQASLKYWTRVEVTDSNKPTCQPTAVKGLIVQAPERSDTASYIT